MAELARTDRTFNSENNRNLSVFRGANSTMGELDRLFDQLFRRTIGFDHLPSTLGRETSFPHYDIYKQDDNTYVVAVALAGYRPSDVEVFQEDWDLVIRSSNQQHADNSNSELSESGWNRDDDSRDDQSTKGYLHKGIAKRKFNMKLSLGRHAQITDATMKDGMLYVTVEQHANQDVKQIPVNTG